MLNTIYSFLIYLNFRKDKWVLDTISLFSRLDTHINTHRETQMYVRGVCLGYLHGFHPITGYEMIQCFH